MCSGRHHTSICEKRRGNFLTATVTGQVIHPMVLVDVDGIRSRARLDTGASSSYSSSALINALGKKMIKRETTEVEMMLETKKRVVDIYDVQLTSIEGDLSMKIKLAKFDKPLLNGIQESMDYSMEYFWGTFEVLLEYSMEYFWGTFGVLLEYFWSTFGALLEYFWSTFRVLLEYFLGNFGVLLEYFWARLE